MASSSTSSLNFPHPIWTVESLTKQIIGYKSSKKPAGEGSTDVDSLPNTDVDSLPSTDVDSLPELDSHEIDTAIPNGETVPPESEQSFSDPVPAISSQEEISEPVHPLAELRLQEKLRKNLERAMEQQSKESQRITIPLSFSMPGITIQSVQGYEMNAWLGSAQAGRDYMEDRSIFKPIRFVVGKEACYADVAGVFDGHGTAIIAQYIQENLHVFLQTTLELYHKDKEKVSDYAIWKALRKTFRLLHRLSPQQTIYHGSTAIVAFIFKQVIWVANAGDCRAIFCPNNPEEGICVTLSEDASLDNPRFIKKVLKRGGKITKNRNGVNRVNGILALASSLCDHRVINTNQECCMPHTPIVTRYPLIKEANSIFSDSSSLSPSSHVGASSSVEEVKPVAIEGFLLLASDGLWHQFSSLEVAGLITNIRNKVHKAFIAQTVVSSALTAGAKDNISVVVIPLLSNQVCYEGTKRARRE
jgi:serine/threonine protein phosphatase PrpC